MCFVFAYIGVIPCPLVAGVLLYEILSGGAHPYADVTDELVVWKNVVEGLRLPRPPQCPESIFAIAEQCWQTDRALRPSFSSLHQQLTAIYAGIVKSNDATSVQSDDPSLRSEDRGRQSRSRRPDMLRRLRSKDRSTSPVPSTATPATSPSAESLERILPAPSTVPARRGHRSRTPAAVVGLSVSGRSDKRDVRTVQGYAVEMTSTDSDGPAKSTDSDGQAKSTSDSTDSEMSDASPTPSSSVSAAGKIHPGGRMEWRSTFPAAHVPQAPSSLTGTRAHSPRDELGYVMESAESLERGRPPRPSSARATQSAEPQVALDAHDNAGSVVAASWQRVPEANRPPARSGPSTAPLPVGPVQQRGHLSRDDVELLELTHAPWPPQAQSGTNPFADTMQVPF